MQIVFVVVDGISLDSSMRRRDRERQFCIFVSYVRHSDRHTWEELAVAVLLIVISAVAALENWNHSALEMKRMQIMCYAKRRNAKQMIKCLFCWFFFCLHLYVSMLSLDGILDLHSIRCNRLFRVCFFTSWKTYGSYRIMCRPVDCCQRDTNFRTIYLWLMRRPILRYPLPWVRLLFINTLTDR